jgi:hypothetical protein
MKRIEINLPSLKDTKPHEYVGRFLFGGLATVVAGLIAKRFGPSLGGLFSHSGIFPASVTLIESHERKRKATKCSDGTQSRAHSGEPRFAGSLDGLHSV